MKAREKIYLPFKRLIGILGSLVGIVVCLAFLWWWFFIFNLIATKGHPIFVQKRLGKYKKVFGLIKFRSMKVDASPDLAPSDTSIKNQASKDIWFGHFLRKTSIDETLQLFNILVGHMAFICTRPGATENEEYLIICREKYKPNAFDVKPGISGYAQIKMKRDHNPEKKAQIDNKYVKQMCFWFDFKLFFKNFENIFFSKRKIEYA